MGVRHLWQCTYERERSWDENCERGPQFADHVAEVPPTPLKDFFGHQVHSRIGIAAGLLPNSRWVAGYARRGFDLLTYKTVRSSARQSHPLPNWVFVEPSGDAEGSMVVRADRPDDPTQISSAVCFGMPSVSPEIWRDDIGRARSVLNFGQLLIVSVVGTPDGSGSSDQLTADFALTARWAAESGADVVEANLSCPNVCTAEGTIYQDVELSRRIVERIRDAIGTVPLLLKVGPFGVSPWSREFLQATDGIANGITMVNAVSRPVLDRSGQPAFGPAFRNAGVLGRAIHRDSVSAVHDAVRLIREMQLQLRVVAVGGASTASDFQEFFAEGAHAVLCGSSPMYLPQLACDIKRLHPQW